MSTTAIPETGELNYVTLAELVENPENVRTHYDPAKLKELAASILENGVLQPLRVVPAEGGRGYVVVAGNRRLRALRSLEEQGHVLANVPVMVSTATDDIGVRIDALVENLQREDLNPIDEARGYLHLVELGVSQKMLAARIGRSPGHVSKRLAMLSLPAHVLTAVEKGWLGLELAYKLAQLPADLQSQLVGPMDDPDDATVQIMPRSKDDWEELMEEGDLEHNVEFALRRIEAERKMEKQAAGLRRLGYTVLAREMVGYDQWSAVKVHEPGTTPDVPEGHVLTVDPYGSGRFTQWQPRGDQAEVEAQPDEDSVDGESVADAEDKARRAEERARRAEEERKAREKAERNAAKAKKAEQLAAAQALVAKFKKADVLDLAFTDALTRALSDANAAVQAMAVKILDVEVVRRQVTDPWSGKVREGDEGRTRPDYWMTLKEYLADTGDFRPKAEVYLALRAAKVIAAHGDIGIREYAVERGIDLG